MFGHVLAAFRYGREDLDVLGLTFRKDLYLASSQIFPMEVANKRPLTRLQVTDFPFLIDFFFFSFSCFKFYLLAGSAQQLLLASCLIEFAVRSPFYFAYQSTTTIN